VLSAFRRPHLSRLLRLSLCLNWIAAASFASDPGPALAERRLAVMGTVVDLSVAGASRAEALAASEEAVREIARVEEQLTTWRPGGPLARLNAAPAGNAVFLGPEVAAVIATVVEWSSRTDRAFDPTVLPLVRAWGLRGEGKVTDPAGIAHALAAVGPEHFSIDPERGLGKRHSSAAGIDEGAWGKGYALDRAVAALKRAGVARAVLDLGGQVSAIGAATVAIAHPRERGRSAVILDIADESVSTSGDSERGIVVGGKRIGHLLDPRTGQPAPDFGSATVVAPSGLVADILSTAFFVLGPEKGLALSRRLREQGFENEALFLVVKDGGVERLASPGLKFSF
jgi:thiamine biosynthesis lipoprotein